MNGYTQLTGRPILPPKWVFEPWAGGGAGRWYHGPLHDVCKEQMAVLEQFEELDIPHSGIYAEGAGAHWFKNPKSEELYKIVAFAEKKGIRAFSWQYPDMSMEEARGYLPDIEPEDIPINKIAPHEGNKKLPTYIDFTHPKGMDLLRAQWKVRLDAGIRGTMVDFGDFVPDGEIIWTGKKCIMGMPMSMPKVIENCFANVMEKIMSFIQEAQHLVLRHLPVSLVETI